MQLEVCSLATEPLQATGVSIMVGGTVLDPKPELMTVTVLWRGVIARAIQDWLSRSLRPKREAERYLFENSAGLSLVCALAGIDISKLRTHLNKVRGRTLEDVLPIAA
jgi:hypothetical protein